jgi:hypothetical protein
MGEQMAAIQHRYDEEAIEFLMSGRSLSGIDLFNSDLPDHVGPLIDCEIHLLWDYLHERLSGEDFSERLLKAIRHCDRFRSVGDFLKDPMAQTLELACFGIVVADRIAVAAQSGGTGWSALPEIANLYECSHYVILSRSTSPEWTADDAKRLMSEVARKAALARHAHSPKAKVKQLVRECWLAWEKSPSQDPSTAAFSRSMLDKWPDDLTSEAVISGWVRSWRNEGK